MDDIITLYLSGKKQRRLNPTMSVIQLTFESFEELQTKLILLPRDDEGVGATVTEDFDESSNLRGASLQTCNGNDLYNVDLSEILSAIRSATVPLVLEFTRPEVLRNQSNTSLGNQSIEEEKKVEEPELLLGRSSTENSCDPMLVNDEKVKVSSDETMRSVIDDASSSECGSHHSRSSLERNDHGDQQCQHQEEDPVESLASSRWGDIGAWTSRAAQLSAVAASGAAQFAQAAKERAATAQKGRAMALSVAQALQENASDQKFAHVDMFLHTSSGACLPLNQQQQSSDSFSEKTLTNSSQLSIRKSATEPCPSDSYSFQWYSSAATNDGWVILPGATNATFQPSATEIGHRLRCLVDVTNDFILENEEAETVARQICCETSCTVNASLQLFNGSRQAAVRGTQFGSLIGKGKAEGRSFRIKVLMSVLRDERGQSVSKSAVTIYQVVGSTAEPMHPEDTPILGVTARSDYTNAKGLELVFGQEIPESATMVAALATNGNRFQLEAPNRLARESLLLTLGIANFSGKPSALSSKTMLYDHPTDKPAEPSVVKIDLANSSSSDDFLSKGNALDDDIKRNYAYIPKTSKDADTQSSDEEYTSSTSQVSSSSSNTEHIDTDRMHFLGPPKLQHRSMSLDAFDQNEADRVELITLRVKLERKNRLVSELQRHMGHMESSLAAAERRIEHLEKSMAVQDSEKANAEDSLRRSEKRVASMQEKQLLHDKEHEKLVESLNEQLKIRDNKIAEAEKTVCKLHNEKAVLLASVEARESKLSKMHELQTSLSEMSSKIAKVDSLRNDLMEANQRAKEANQRAQDAEAELERSIASQKATLVQLTDIQSKVNELEDKLRLEKSSTASHHTELEAQQLVNQRLLAERNSFKQKAESLSKEIGRICRNGRSIRDIERVMADDQSRRQETELLREQKRKAISERDDYRAALEQSRMAAQLSGMDHDVARVLERNVELERLLSELSEYLGAKEMQLDTLRQVNAALQMELRDLHKMHLNTNLCKNDV
jgi:hypothetical protein